jgi:hypothetical protein
MQQRAEQCRNLQEFGHELDTRNPASFSALAINSTDGAQHERTSSARARVRIFPGAALAASTLPTSQAYGDLRARGRHLERAHRARCRCALLADDRHRDRRRAAYPDLLLPRLRGARHNRSPPHAVAAVDSNRKPHPGASLSTLPAGPTSAADRRAARPLTLPARITDSAVCLYRVNGRRDRSLSGWSPGSRRLTPNISSAWWRARLPNENPTAPASASPSGQTQADDPRSSKRR